MKQHGIGVGYRYPHEFEGADVDQQYLPDELADRRYYLPTDQGYEATIAARQAARAEARAAAKAAGKTPRNPNPTPEVGEERPDADPRGEPQEAGRDREEGRVRLARRLLGRVGHRLDQADRREQHGDEREIAAERPDPDRVVEADHAAEHAAECRRRSGSCPTR